jgi:sialate O-acetylesterase
MVLQANQPVTFAGKANAGSEVVVSIKDMTKEVIASGKVKVGNDGKWELETGAIDPGLSLSVDVDDGSGERVEFVNVLSGEVWLCTGQSNMRWPVRNANDAESEIKAANYPELRLFSVKRDAASLPLEDLTGEWLVCTPETVAGFSASGYYFGRDLHQALQQPIGLILSATGGTPVQAWIPKEPMAANPDSAVLFDELKAYTDIPREQRAKDGRGNWIYGAKFEKAPARSYNAMIHPLIPYSFKGAIWYQGEANDREGKWGGPSLYKTTFPMLVEFWRAEWKNDFPFIYVELANFMAPQQSPVDEEAAVNWSYIREAQASVLELPNTYFATAIDVGDATTIHPGNKQAVGARLALAALGGVYAAEEAPCLSPRYTGEYSIQDGEIHVQFENAEGGLHTDDGKLPSAFAIRGESGPWYWAECEIDGDEIIAWHSAVSAPVALRYAWANNPDVNVYNQADLPLMPFRTDKD